MLGRFDRYALKRLSGAAGFFALVFIGLFWINQSLAVFDRVIADGRSLLVFLRLILFYLPEVVAIMLPVVALAAPLQFFHRLAAERELVAWFAGGALPARTLRPVAVFALLMAALSMLFAHFLAPLGRDRLSVAGEEIDRESFARLIRPRNFVTLAPGVTVFVGDIDREGAFHDLFLHDERTPERPVTFIARAARLLRGEERVILSMEQGQTQRLDRNRHALGTLSFERFDYDLTPFLAHQDVTGPDHANVRLLTTPELVDRRRDLPLATLEITDRMMQFVFTFVLPFLAAAAMMAGPQGRNGGGWRIALAVGIALLVNLANGRMLDLVHRSPAAWPAAFVPSLVAALAAFWLLRRAGRPLLPALRHRTGCGEAKRPC